MPASVAGMRLLSGHACAQARSVPSSSFSAHLIAEKGADMVLHDAKASASVAVA
jgi:hypothetical protein